MDNFEDSNIYEGWDEGEVEDTEDLIEAEDEQNTTEEESAPEGPESVEPVGEPEESEESDEESKPTLVHYKYNGNEGDLTVEEASEYVQKGMNYDKIYEKYAALKGFEGREDHLAFIDEVAKANKMSVDDLIDDWRAGKLANEKKISRDAAKLLVLKDKIAKGKAKPKAKTPEEVEADAKAKREGDYRAFFKEFPEVKPADIPREVWADYTAGKDTLNNLYIRYENKRLREKKSTDESDRRSTGSQKKNTPKSKDDYLFEGWGD